MQDCQTTIEFASFSIPSPIHFNLLSHSLPPLNIKKFMPPMSTFFLCDSSYNINNTYFGRYFQKWVLLDLGYNREIIRVTYYTDSFQTLCYISTLGLRKL